jgi:hypothetical protein
VCERKERKMRERKRGGWAASKQGERGMERKKRKGEVGVKWKGGGRLFCFSIIFFVLSGDKVSQE